MLNKSIQKQVSHLIATFFCILMMVFLSCNGQKKQLEREKFVDILFDLHTAEVLSSLSDSQNKVSLSPVKDSAELIANYQSVFNKHNVTFDAFYETYYYYVYKETAELDTIYKILQAKVADLQNIQPIQPGGIVDEGVNPLDSTKNALRPEKLNINKNTDTIE